MTPGVYDIRPSNDNLVNSQRLHITTFQKVIFILSVALWLSILMQYWINHQF